MTPDRALKESILPNAPKMPKVKPAPKERTERKARPIWVSMAIRGGMVLVTALIIRTMIYTPQGEALMQQAAETIASFIGPPPAEETAAAVTEPATGASMLRDAADGAEGASIPRVSSMPGDQGVVRRLSE